MEISTGAPFNYESFHDFCGEIFRYTAVIMESGKATEAYIHFMMKVALFPKAMHYTCKFAHTGVYKYFPGKSVDEVINFFKTTYVEEATNEVNTVINNVLINKCPISNKDLEIMDEFFYNNRSISLHPLYRKIEDVAKLLVETDKYMAYIESHNPKNSDTVKKLLKTLYMTTNVL